MSTPTREINRDGVAFMIRDALHNDPPDAKFRTKLLNKYSTLYRVDQLLAMLYDDIERAVVIYYYALYTDSDALTLVKIGDRFGWSESIVRAAKANLQAELRQYFLGRVCLYVWTADPELRALGLEKDQINRFLKSGIFTLRELLDLTPTELADIEGFGPHNRQQLIDALARQELSLRSGD